MLEKYSVTLQYFIRRAEARLLLESAGQIFGTPTPQIIEKVDEATSEKLLAWTIRLRTAQSWTDLIANSFLDLSLQTSPAGMSTAGLVFCSYAVTGGHSGPPLRGFFH